MSKQPKSKELVAAYINKYKLETALSDAVNRAITAGSPHPITYIAEVLLDRYPVRNDHPALAKTPSHATEMMANWLLFLPPAAVAAFSLEPNMNAETGLEKTLWCGRLCNFRKIRWLQYCKARNYSLEVGADRLVALEAHFGEEKNAKMLVKVQAILRGSFARLRSKPIFLNELAGLSIKGIMTYMHGSGGMSWANPRLCRIAANAGCIVFAPDHMSSSEWRSKELRPLLNSSDDTGYWEHDLFYGTKADVEGEELWFSTSVEGVRGDPDYYKKLYEKIFQVRRAEIHYLLKRLPKVAQAMGVVLFGTSEGAMTVHRFDDQRYGAMIRGRIINAFGCEYCYFTPTEEAALLGGSKDVPTLNMIGTCDEYFGPPPDDEFTYLCGYKKTIPDDGGYPTYGAIDTWHGSKCYKIAQDPCPPGYGDPKPTGNGYKAFVKQGLRKALVATVVGGQHDLTLNADNEARDILIAFLSNPEKCTEAYDRWQATSAGYVASVEKKGHHVAEGSEVLYVELSQPHGIHPAVPYIDYLRQAAQFARKKGFRAKG